jgi:hypothetical protein
MMLLQATALATSPVMNAVAIFAGLFLMLAMIVQSLRARRQFERIQIGLLIVVCVIPALAAFGVPVGPLAMTVIVCAIAIRAMMR